MAFHFLRLCTRKEIFRTTVIPRSLGIFLLFDGTKMRLHEDKVGSMSSEIVVRSLTAVNLVRLVRGCFIRNTV